MCVFNVFLYFEYFVNNNIKRPVYFGELKTFPITALRYKGFNEVLADNNIKPMVYYKEKGKRAYLVVLFCFRC